MYPHRLTPLLPLVCSPSSPLPLPPRIFPKKNNQDPFWTSSNEHTWEIVLNHPVQSHWLSTSLVLMGSLRAQEDLKRMELRGGWSWCNHSSASSRDWTLLLREGEACKVRVCVRNRTRLERSLLSQHPSGIEKVTRCIETPYRVALNNVHL